MNSIFDKNRQAGAGGESPLSSGFGAWGFGSTGASCIFRRQGEAAWRTPAVTINSGPIGAGV